MLGRRFFQLCRDEGSHENPRCIAVMERTHDLTPQGLGVFCILHDINLAAAYADELLLFPDGCGTAEEVLKRDLIRAIYGVPVAVTRNPAGGIGDTRGLISDMAPARLTSGVAAVALGLAEIPGRDAGHRFHKNNEYKQVNWRISRRWRDPPA